MEQGQPVAFGPFRFDVLTERLWQGEREIVLRARARAVLRYFVAHPGRLIAREEFAQHVWGGTHVSKTALRVCIWEIRQALDDQAAIPQYIETVGQQGYRFLAKIVEHGADRTASTSPFVGRQAELARLQACLAQAQRGQPQLVLVTGEAGVGKTALVQQFLAYLTASGPAWVGQGQCIDHAGPGEAYLPLLEALGRLGRAPGGDRLLAALRHAAPTWLVHLPLLLEASAQETVQRQAHRAGHERLLRELVEALTLVTAEHTLVLVLEDLQWSDAATVEWLAYVARRADRLRLLVLGTYRPAEVIARGHPLRQTVQELVAHRLCQEVRLELLTAAEVQAYVAQRLGTSPVTAALGKLIHQRTDGNALFMVHVLDYLLEHGLLVQDGGRWRLRDGMTTLAGVLPDSLRALIGRQLEALTPEAQQCLAVASVAEGQFTAAEVAAGRQCPVEEVEAVCDGLQQRGQFIAAQGVAEWPDGTVTAQYAFGHAVYQAVVYERLGQAERVRLHRLLGKCLESGYGERARELAGVLAFHFERGRDVWRALEYRRQVAEQAVQRSVYAEALAHWQQGLALLETLPETPERMAQELALRTRLSAVLTATQGFASPALEQNLQRARALCQAMAATVERVPVLVSLARLSMVQAERAATEALMAQERHLLERVHDPAALVQLHTQLGTAETLRGAYVQAQEHQAHALRLYDPVAHRSLALTFSVDPGGITLAMSGWRLWLTGWPAQAADAATRALRQAEALQHPFTLVVILFLVGHVRRFCGELDAAWALTQRMVALERTQGFSGLYEAFGMMTQGGILVQRGDLAAGMAQLITGLRQYQEYGAQIFVPFFLALLAEAHLRAGQVEEGLHVIDAALRLTASNFDRFWEAELHRLWGELLLRPVGARKQAKHPGAEAAETCFAQALATARQQGAKALELRAAISLSRLWQTQGQHDAARTLLADVYGWFTEGFDTADLRAARALLEVLDGTIPAALYQSPSNV
jgi:DNA-binding winged helix-turn-helix (wHTH) protein/predicted ATPase